MKKRIVAALLSAAFALTSAIPIYAFADETTTKTYSGNGYEITYNIKAKWTGNQNVEVTLTNTGDDSLLNWALKYDAHGDIKGLWNGAVYSIDSTKCIIKNAGYNYEILPEQSVTFGYTLSGKYMGFPEIIELCSYETVRETDGYNVDLEIVSDWDTGFIGSITVENIGDIPLEAWELSFDSNFTIENIWNAQILSEFGNHYTVRNDVTTTPIGIGEKKSFGIQASKESKMVPEINNFYMSEIVVNDDFSTIEIPDFELAVSGFANYSSEENAINIFWFSNNENGKFELMESIDNEKYFTKAILYDEYSYTYPIIYDFERVYFKVIQTTDNGESAETPVFYVEKQENGYGAKFIDSDEDGLPDFIEEQIGTDINDPDTDGDNLTDYQEYYILGTDPLDYDSVEEGVSDADADCDGDGLSNIKELELGTKPFNPDTDGDGLSDGDEVYIYGTDPLEFDTDGDCISDGDEVIMGTDPLSPYTDGVADSERTFEQTIDADDEALSNINTAYNPYELSLEITAAGNAHTSLTVQESGYTDAMFNWSILGFCPELIYDNSCKVDEVVVKFKVDDEYIDNEGSEYSEENPEFVGIKRYNIFRFFEEDNILLPIKTDVDVENNTVSATTTDLGTYCLIDMEMLLEDIVAGKEVLDDNTESDIESISGGNTTAMLGASSFGILKLTGVAASPKIKPELEYGDDFNIVFMFDTYAEGYSDFYNSVCETTDFVFNKSSNANVYFIALTDITDKDGYFAYYETPAAGYSEVNQYDFHDSFLRDRHFTDHKPSKDSKNTNISDAFDFVVNGMKDKNGNYTKIVDTDLPTLCFSFVSDENSFYRESNGYSLINEMTGNVYVCLIGIYDFESYQDCYAKNLCQQTGGKFFEMSSGANISGELIRYIYELSESEDIPDMDKKYPMILSTGLGYVELDEPITIEYKNAASMITSYNRDKFSDYADTDKDGLYDFEEIDFRSGLIKTNSGRIVLPTFGECVDYYGSMYFYVKEGLDRYYEEIPNYTAAYQQLIHTRVLPINSDPARKDSDGDGLLDNDTQMNEWGLYIKDPEPLKYNNFIYFGTDEYFDSLDKIVADSGYIGSEDRAYINEMMDQVNNAVCYEYIPFEHWDSFCNFFNSKVRSLLLYELTNSASPEIIDQDLHYFRNKLNRAPKTLNDLIAQSEKWDLLTASNSQYHMYDTYACYDEINDVYKGEYNLKFVSKDGKYEAVYNYRGELLDENNDATNMGTYNYGSPNDLVPFEHFLLDILPYSDEDYIVNVAKVSTYIIGYIIGYVIGVPIGGPMLGTTYGLAIGAATSTYAGIVFKTKGWYNVPGGYVDCIARSKNEDKFKNNEDAKVYREEIEERLI